MSRHRERTTPDPVDDPRVTALWVDAGERAGECKYCGQRIFWATRGGKRVPVNVEPGRYGREPTATTPGQGTAHHVWCTAPRDPGLRNMAYPPRTRSR